MSETKAENVFKTPRPSPRSKAQATDIAFKAIVKEETEKRDALMRRQRQARLAREAELADAPPPEKPKRRRSPAKKAAKPRA